MSTEKNNTEATPENPTPTLVMGPNNGTVTFKDEPQTTYVLNPAFALNDMREVYAYDPLQIPDKLNQLSTEMALHMVPVLGQRGFEEAFALLKGMEYFFREFMVDEQTLKSLTKS